MDDRTYQKYTEKREKLIKNYKSKKIKNAACILGIACVCIALDICFASLINNIAVTLVIGAMLVMFSIIYLRIRLVTINHAMQQKLQQFEQDFELYEKN